MLAQIRTNDVGVLGVQKASHVETSMASMPFSPDGWDQMLATQELTTVLIDLNTSPATSIGETPSVPVREVLRLWPNPFNPRVRIEIDHASPGSVAVEVIDVSGRRVKRLHSGPWRPGRHELEWDGSDEGGSPVGTGTYLIRYTTAERQHTVKAVLLR